MTDRLAPEEVDALYRQVAIKRVLHLPWETIISDLGITKNKYYRLIKTEEYKSVLKEISEEATKEAIATWKASMADLVQEAHRVIKAKLADDDLEAVKIVMKSIGIEAQVPTQQATSLTVVLPDLSQGQPKPVDIEVK